MNTPTATPWYIDLETSLEVLIGAHSEKDYVASLPANQRANAELIVKAVNNHEALTLENSQLKASIAELTRERDVLRNNDHVYEEQIQRVKELECLIEIGLNVSIIQMAEGWLKYKDGN